MKTIQIYQGTNSPIILEIPFDMNGIKKISAGLWIAEIEQKHWSIDDVSIEDNKFLILPINERESVNFKVGIGKVEIKMLNNQDEIIHFDDVTANVIKKKDKSKMITL